MTPTPAYIAETSFHVRYAETDAMGVVHHASYIVYLEEGRSHYARSRGTSYAEFERGGLILVVAEVQARYHRPAYYDDRLTVRCWIEHMGTRGLTFAYEIIRAATDEKLVTAHTRHICIDRNGQVTRLPEAWRTWGHS
jgi:acyl-CoA thioester hydrolase